MRELIDLTGRKFGELTVLGPAERPMHTKANKGRWWVCLCRACGKKHTTRHCALTKKKGIKSCGCVNLRTGSESPRYQGGSISSQGYRRNRIAGKLVFEHRLVMEQKLGRKLLPNENVHHKNGDRADNRLSNLELWIKRQPCGQRVQDIVAQALRTLKLYAPDKLKQTTQTITCLKLKN